MKASTSRAKSSIGFDWLMGVLAALLMGGLLIDGWAHSHGEVDQSFLTPWHALLYGSVAVNGLVLLIGGIIGLRKGFSFRNALPPGYWVSAFGVVIFLVGGGFDAWWHTKFGIESGIVLLVSPPHLILALAAAMIMSGPLQSIAAQYSPSQGGWKIVGPAILSTWAILTIIGFFLAYAQPVEDGFSASTLQPSTGSAVYPMVYVAQANGSLTRITEPPKTDLFGIDVSPDGKRIVYRVNRYEDPNSEPPSDLYVANIDGSHPVRITNSGRHDTQPQWSPDGKWIAYASIPAETSGNFAIMLVSPDGTSQQSLLSQQATTQDPVWSPDGTSIAYASRNGITGMIGVLDVKTKAARWLPFTANSSSPAWTSAGLYYLNNDGSLHVSQIDGSNQRTVLKKTSGGPIPSPDGRRIAFLSTDLGSQQLFVANSDGSAPRDLTQLSGLDVQAASWAPGGRLIFTATGRSDPTYTDLGKSLAMAAIIIEGILVAAAALLLVRRWPLPFGALTFIFTFYTLAMAVESDYYLYAIGGFVTGLLADIAIAVFKDRMRAGRGFYALGFLLPLVYTALWEIISAQMFHGTGWSSNLLLGAPILAGAAGLALSLVIDSPLEVRPAASKPAAG
jgi:Tol biopolymer transport system component